MNQAITVCAFLHKEGKLFAPRRALTKKFLPNKVELPGGHLEVGESPENALMREMKEEFNVEINVGDPFYIFTYSNSVKKTFSVEIIYFASIKQGTPDPEVKPDQHSEYFWLGPEQVEEYWDKHDQEYPAVIKGFQLLKGLSINVG